MNDTQKMFQMLITMRGDLLARFDKFETKLNNKVDDLDNKLSSRIDDLDKKMDKGFKEVNNRIDKIGLQLANLEDDTPTREEFDKLESKVIKIEKILATA